MSNHMMGMDGFKWWFGIVEDRKDPLNVGRVKVRVYAWHSESKQTLPTENLPWAQIVIPPGSTIAAPPKEGQTVFGFFLDGEAGQFPMVLGQVPNIPDIQPQIQKGFSDARTDDDLKSAPRPPQKVEYQSGGAVITEASNANRNPQTLNEPTTSRLARNEKIDQTVIGQINNNLKTNIQSTDDVIGGTVWSEPKSAYAAKYPYNHVTESESGHIIEVDDTPGAERLSRIHRSGTYEEIRPNGSRTLKIVKDNYTIILAGEHVYIAGDCLLTIDGKQNVKIGGDLNFTLGGSEISSITKDKTETVKGNETETTSGNRTITVEGNLDITATGNMNLKAANIKLQDNTGTAPNIDATLH